MTYAKNWDISKPLRDKIKLKDIEKNFNDIHNAEELQNFILYLSQNYPFTSLEARKVHRKWLIQGNITSYIRDVSVTLMTKKAAKSITGWIMKYGDDFFGGSPPTVDDITTEPHYLQIDGMNNVRLSFERIYTK